MSATDARLTYRQLMNTLAHLGIDVEYWVVDPSPQDPNDWAIIASPSHSCISDGEIECWISGVGADPASALQDLWRQLALCTRDSGMHIKQLPPGSPGRRFTVEPWTHFAVATPYAP